MSLFFRGCMSFFRQKVDAFHDWMNGGLDPFGFVPPMAPPDPPTDEDCRIAYEWLMHGPDTGSLVAQEGSRQVFKVTVPTSVRATLRKLGAA